MLRAESPASIYPLSPSQSQIRNVRSVLDLNRALQGPIDGVIWNRIVPQPVQNWLDMLVPEHLPDGRFVLEPKLAGPCIEALFAAHGHAPCPSLRWLSQDVQTLAEQVTAIDRTERLRLRLEKVDDDACRKMHIDSVVARLICTYRGPGTVLGVQTQMAEIEQSVPTGAPILFKGKLWPSDPPPSLRHRSPRIEGSGLTRLVLVLESCPDDALRPTHDSVYEGGSISR